ncbi:hypothetical protein [Halorussus halophilus]|uniref:hypothetical protein n=1 Tax=Halorussus halophilus TaxID=2650975 RepID=UPI0013011FCA|nr:hypothetical protein [Halorussus halophilus]
MNDDTVLERRDASDLETNDEVEQTVDEMLDTDDLETGKSGDEGAAEASTGGNESSAADPENFDFENQEWTLGGKREPEVHEIQGMKFLFEEPENDDTVLNELDQVGDDDRSAQMKALVQLVVAKPEVTDDRWEQMSFAAKLGLAGQAAEFLGLGEGFLNE